VIAIDLALARRLALSVVLGQAAVTAICALAAWLIADAHAALSAALGGGISTVASLAMAFLGVGGRSAVDPQRALRTFFVGETAKVFVMIVLFIVVLKTMKVVPLAMLGTYAATFLVFWVALANLLPPLGGTGQGSANAKAGNDLGSGRSTPRSELNSRRDVKRAHRQ
jgi:ATP synthase protein I